MTNSKFRPKQLLLALTMGAFLLRFYRIDEQSIWFDESLSALFAVQFLPIAIQSMLQEGLHHSPLFYILIRPFVTDNFSEFAVRFLPAVLGVLAIPLIAQLGRVLINRRVGMFAAGLLSLSPFHVWYSQEARMYTLLVVCALGAMVFFVQNFKQPRWQNWLALAFFVAVGINSHHFAFFIPLVQFVFIVLTLKQSYPLLRPWVGAQVLAGLTLIPWILIVLDWGQFYLSSASRQAPILYDLLQTFWNFSLGYTVNLTPLVLAWLALFLGLVMGGIRATYRTRQGLLLILWLTIPPVITFLVSLRLPTYLDRYLIISLPPLLLLAAVGLARLKKQRVQLTVVLLLVSVMGFNLYRVYYDTSVYNRADWRTLGVYLEEHVDPDDEVAVWFQQYLIPLKFYYAGPHEIQPIISFNVINLPTLDNTDNTSAKKLWLIIDHPNQSAHLVGHCQPFDMAQIKSPAETKAWRLNLQNRLIEVVEVACIRLEIYQ